MLNKRFGSKVFLGILFFIGGLGVAGTKKPSIERPIALDALPSTGLVVLEGRGTIYQLRGGGAQYSVSAAFNIPVNQYPVDLTLAQIRGQFFVFVSSNMTSGFGDSGRITQYTLDGKVVRYWSVHGTCSGIDFDGKTHTVYLASSNHNEILAIKFKQSGEEPEVSFLGEVSGVGQIGPLAYDAASSKIYVGDVTEGGLYAFDLATKKTALLASRLGIITALRIGPNGQLIAADSEHNRVVILDMTKKASQRVLKTTAHLRHPSGLAFVDPNLLAVSDSDANRIFFLSTRGDVVGEF